MMFIIQPHDDKHHPVRQARGLENLSMDIRMNRRSKHHGRIVRVAAARFAKTVLAAVGVGRVDARSWAYHGGL